LISALRVQPRAGEVEGRLDRLSLKEVYLRLREGDTQTAVTLVRALHNSPHLEQELLRFYEEAGCSHGKFAFLKQKLVLCLETDSQEASQRL
jgi:hypothetical protein